MSAPLILVPGIVTGRTDARRRATFAAVLYQVAREAGARLVAPPSSPVGRNYDLALMDLANGRRVRFMLNAAVRVVGVAADDDPLRLDAPFLDVPRPDLFELANLYTMSAYELEQPLTGDMIANLHPRERRDIAHHQPNRVGRRNLQLVRLTSLRARAPSAMQWVRQMLAAALLAGITAWSPPWPRCCRCWTSRPVLLGRSGVGGVLGPQPRPSAATIIGSPAAGVAMAFNLIESQARWRTVNAPHLVALVRAGREHRSSQLVERPGKIRR